MRILRFSGLLTPSERERLASLNARGLPQYARDDVASHGNEYWRNWTMASHIAAEICLDETFERQQEVTELLMKNAAKSRRVKIYGGVVRLAAVFALLWLAWAAVSNLLAML